MKFSTFLVYSLASASAGSAYQVCWTNGLNMLLGGKPWGPGCQGTTLPVNPKPPAPPPAPCPACPSCPACPPTPPPVYKIDPAVAANAKSVCATLNPPRSIPLFDENGNPQCCGPVMGLDANGNYGQICP